MRNLTNKQFLKWLKKNGACYASVSWVRAHPTWGLLRLWRGCQEPEWMVWLVGVGNRSSVNNPKAMELEGALLDTFTSPMMLRIDDIWRTELNPESRLKKILEEKRKTADMIRFFLPNPPLKYVR